MLSYVQRKHDTKQKYFTSKWKQYFQEVSVRYSLCVIAKMLVLQIILLFTDVDSACASRCAWCILSSILKKSLYKTLFPLSINLFWFISTICYYKFYLFKLGWHRIWNNMCSTKANSVCKCYINNHMAWCQIIFVMTIEVNRTF